MMEMKFRFLDGADSIGCMGMMMDSGKKKFLVEYGLSATKPPKYPMPVSKVDYIFLTHCHLDHCGMIPQVYKKNRCELFTTPLTAEIAEMMMFDSLKIAKAENYPLPYTSADIEKTMNKIVPMTFNDTLDIGDMELTMHSAGHVPGAAMFEFGIDTKTVYSGDIHTIKQRTVNGATPVKCENLFIEGTYGGKFHVSRQVVEDEFLKKISEVIDRGGTVLIPCFAVGRTQEIMILLKKLNYNMWVDGMGRSVTRLYIKYPEYLANPKEMKTAKKRFNEVQNARMRKSASMAEIIITTSGVLDGGPALNYVKLLKNDPKNAILLVGYQAENTNGRLLIEKGYIMIDNEIHKINCEVKKYDFSAHADHEQIVNFVKACDPTNVIIMHSETREMFLEDLSDYNVILPSKGEEFILDV